MIASSILSPPTRTERGIDDAAERQHARPRSCRRRCRRPWSPWARSPAGRRRSPPPSAPRSGQTLRAPALSADSRIARRSTAVEPEGTQMIICGLVKLRRLCTLRMKCLIISSATSKSAMTPSRKGRMAVMLAGRAAQHHLGLVAHRQHLLAPLVRGDGDDRRLVQHDAAALDVDQRVRRAQVDGHVRRQHAQ